MWSYIGRLAQYNFLWKDDMHRAYTDFMRSSPDIAAIRKEVAFSAQSLFFTGSDWTFIELCHSLLIFSSYPNLEKKNITNLTELKMGPSQKALIEINLQCKDIVCFTMHLSSHNLRCEQNFSTGRKPTGH